MSSSSKTKRKRKPTTGAFNQSRVRLFAKCEKAYYFRYDYARVAMGVKKGELVAKRPSQGLRKGSWMHELMATYRKGGDWQERHEELADEFDDLFEEEREYYGDMPTECQRLMKRYLRYWADDDERYHTVRLPKGGPAVEFMVEVPLEKYGLPNPFKGQIDWLVRDDEYGGLWIWDEKWVKSLPGPDERMMAPQNIMYAWALRDLGYDIRGFVYDYGRTKPPTEPHVNQNGRLSVAKKIDTDYLTYAAAIRRQHGKEWREMARTVYAPKLAELKNREVLWFNRQRIPVEGPRIEQGFREYIEVCKRIYKRGMPIRNYVYSCKFNCEYHDPCVAQFQGLDIKGLMKTQYRVEEERYDMQEIN